MSVNEFIRSTGKKFGPLGAAFMMNPAAGAAGESIGLDFFSYYGLGRGGVLGDVDGKTVADAFYFFNPDLVAGVWDTAKAKHDPREVAAHYANSCAAWGREALAGIEGLDEFTKLGERIAQDAEPTPSSSLFVGWREMPLPDDAAGRAAVQCILVLRELRGNAHVEAVKRVGLEPRQAVAVNSPHMYQLFGWTDEMPDAEPLKPKAAEAEDITDELVAPAFAGLSDAERDKFATVLGSITTKLGV
jgi:hypothetical protein